MSTPARETLKNLKLKTTLIDTVLLFLAQGGTPNAAWHAALTTQKLADTDPRHLLQDLLLIQFLGDTAPGERKWHKLDVADPEEFRRVCSLYLEGFREVIGGHLCEECAGKLHGLAETLKFEEKKG